jgi:diguanylate cyclase (GGDEF)-like protein
VHFWCARLNFSGLMVSRADESGRLAEKQRLLPAVWPPVSAHNEAPTHAEDGLSLSLLEQELLTKRWHLGFDPAVEARFAADTGQARRRQLLLAGLVAVVVFDLFLLNDGIVRPEILAAAIFWRLGVTTPYCLLVLVLIRVGLPPRWREASMASALVITMLSCCMIFWQTSTPMGVYDPFTFGLVFMAGNIVLGMRLIAATVGTTLALLLVMFFVLRSPLMPADAQMFAIGLMLGTAVFTLVAGYRIEFSMRQSYLLKLREEIRTDAARQSAQAFDAISRTDALTGLPNRRAFDIELSKRWAAGQSAQQTLAALLIDIDHFKRYNDRFGHPAGDACLRRVAAVMRDSLRDTDFIARMGGEEFVVLLQAPSDDLAHKAAERLRLAVEGLGLAHDGQAGQQVVTVSLGVAKADLDRLADEHSLIQAADSALYEAKRQGRNRWAQYAPQAALDGIPGPQGLTPAVPTPNSAGSTPATPCAALPAPRA